MNSETDPFKVTMLPNPILFIVDLLAALDSVYHHLSPAPHPTPHFETLSTLGFHDNVVF